MNRRNVLAMGMGAALLPLGARAHAANDRCVSATLVAAHKPAPDSWVFAGEGYRVSEPIDLREGLVYLTADLRDSPYAAVEVHSYPEGDWRPGLNITAGDAFVGTVVDTIYDAGHYIVSVKSGGQWTILIEQPIDT